MKSSMGLMSDGMAVAMYTTLAGLVGSILLKIQYYMLDAATAAGVLATPSTLTETRVVPALERTRMIDDFGLYPREEPFDPFSVMLFKALQVVAFLFFIALLAISPDAKEGKVDSKAEFIITMDWPDNHPDDLDLFVAGPGRQHRLVSPSRGRLHGARPRRPRRRQRFHRRQRQEDRVADPRGDRHHPRHRARRIHGQRQPFPGDDQAAGAGDSEGAEAQSDRPGRLRRQGVRRSHRRREDGRALHDRRRGQGHRRQSAAEIADGDLPQRPTAMGRDLDPKTG